MKARTSRKPQTRVSFGTKKSGYAQKVVRQHMKKIRKSGRGR